MAPRYSYRRQTTKTNSHERKYKGKHYQCQDDSDSATTASPASSLVWNSDSDQDWRSNGTDSWNNGQDMSAENGHKTSLRSLRTKAQMFVPGVTDLPGEGADPTQMPPFMMPPPCIPTPGKDLLFETIRKTLGNEVWNLNMMDYTDQYTGEWSTAVEVTIPALNASKCHLVAGQDEQAIAAAQQESQDQAMQSLTKALANKPGMVIQTSDHRAQISAEYCAADKTKLCREFSHFGSCPRCDTCRWAHAMVETFLINFILEPLCPWDQFEMPAGDNQQLKMPIVSSIEGEKVERWEPRRPPMPPSEEAAKDTEVINAVKIEPMKKVKVVPETRPKDPRFASRARWSDISEDSDSDGLIF